MESYFTNYYGRRVSMTADKIIIEEKEIKWSGLYNEQGEKLYKEPSERVKIGFQPHQLIGRAVVSNTMRRGFDSCMGRQY